MTEREEFEKWFRDTRQFGEHESAAWDAWQAAYAAGVAAERERCAALCDSMGSDFLFLDDGDKFAADACWQCAAAIRAQD